MNDSDARYVFGCRECGESVGANAPVREALVANGCPLCGAAVSTSAFSGATAAERR